MKPATSTKRSNSPSCETSPMLKKSKPRNVDDENLVNDEQQPSTSVVLAPPSTAYQLNLQQLKEILSKHFEPNLAFTYDFINQMKFLIRDEQGRISFEQIGHVLAAGTRLWTSKVALCRHKIQQISNSLTMGGGLIEDDDEENFLLDFNWDRKRKSITKKKFSKNISKIVTNLNAINGKLKTNIATDPVFHQLSAAFDIAAVDSLLLTNLPQNETGVLQLDSNEMLNFNLQESTSNLLTTLSTFPTIIDDFDGIVPVEEIRDFSFTARPTIVSTERTAESFQSEVEEMVVDFDRCSINAIAAGADENATENVSNYSANDLLNENFLKRNLGSKSTTKRSNRRMNHNSGNANHLKRKRKLSRIWKANEYNLSFSESLFAPASEAITNFTNEANLDSADDSNQIKADHGFTDVSLRSSFTKLGSTFGDLLAEDDGRSTSEQNFRQRLNSNDLAKEVSDPIGIKCIKNTMWNIICQKTNLECSSLTFSALQAALHSNTKLNTSTSFVTLLHLCNDKNLQLSAIEGEDKSGNSDFSIQISSD